jgi:lysozyme family protein
MADFNLYFPTLLRNQGGFVDDPADPGGASNMGITMAQWQQGAQSLLGVPPTLENLRALTVAQAAVIYKTDFWNGIQGDQIASQALADIVFDFFVQAGSHAILLLQDLLNVAPTGTFDAALSSAVNATDTADLYARYRQGRINYFQELAASHPVLQRFLPGWLERSESFPATLPPSG